MADQKTPFAEGYPLFYPLDSLSSLFDVVGAKSKKGFFERIAQLELEEKEGLPLDVIKKVIHIGVNFDPSDRISMDQTTKFINMFYKENGYDALENLLYDAFADSGLIDKKDREDGKKYMEERKRLIADQKFLELKELENRLAEKKKKIEEAEAERKAKLEEAGKGESI
jgi:hypothetical protein